MEKLISHSGSSANTSYRFATIGFTTRSPNVHIEERNSAASARNSLPFDSCFASVMMRTTFHVMARPFARQPLGKNLRKQQLAENVRSLWFAYGSKAGPPARLRILFCATTP